MNLIRRLLVVWIGGIAFLTHVDASDESIKPLFLYNNHEIETEVAVSDTIFHYKLNYISPQEAQSKLALLYPNTIFSILEEQQLLTVKTNPKDIVQIRNILEQWDTVPVQIRFYTHIYEATIDSLKSYQNLLSGLNDPISIQYDFSANRLSSISSLISHLQNLERNGKATLLAHPMISTTLQRPSEIRIGDKLPYRSSVSNGTVLSSTINQVNTGLQVKITPVMVSVPYIQIQLEAVIETVKVWKQLHNTEFPVLSERFVQTEITLKENQPFIIAGLTQENQKNNISNPSLFNKVPLLKYLSTRKKQETSKTDLIIIIVPEILTPSETIKAAISKN